MVATICPGVLRVEVQTESRLPSRTFSCCSSPPGTCPHSELLFQEPPQQGLNIGYVFARFLTHTKSQWSLGQRYLFSKLLKAVAGTVTSHGDTMAGQLDISSPLVAFTQNLGRGRARTRSQQASVKRLRAWVWTDLGLMSSSITTSNLQDPGKTSALWTVSFLSEMEVCFLSWRGVH